MASKDRIEVFARSLSAEVAEASSTGSPYEVEEFTRIVLERLGDEGVFENPILLMQEGTFGRGKYAISGFSLSEEEDRLVLFATLHTGVLPPGPLTLTALRHAAELAARFLWYSAQGLHEKIEPANTDASDLARRLFALSSVGRISHLKVVVLTDSLTSSKTLEISDHDGTNVEVELLGIERLQRILGEGASREEIVIDLEEYGLESLPCLDCGYEGDYRAYLAVVPGTLLSKVYDQYGMRLLELNVRAFLGVKGRKSVNSGLRATLRDEPRHFLAYNNGIVATVDSVDLVKGSDGSVSIRRLKGLQIVNGGQTTASIHRAARIDRLDVSSVMVPAKIIVVVSEELSKMVVAISRSANSQNTVQPADFSANDPFHVAIEALAANTWLPSADGRWFYERSRGSYGAAEAKATLKSVDIQRFKRETPKDRRFSKPDLAKYLNTWEGFPHHVSFGGQKNFELFMQRVKELHPNGMEPDDTWFRRLIAIALVHKALQKIVRRMGFPAYQANIATYTLAWLGWSTGGLIDFELIWSQQRVSEELLTVLENWTPLADEVLRSTAGSRMPTEWAKKPECWEAFKQALPELPLSLPPELASLGEKKHGRRKSKAFGKPISSNDLSMISRVRDMDAATWLRIATWGKKNQRTLRLATIAETLAGYAADGWLTSPSVKQAKCGIEISELHSKA